MKKELLAWSPHPDPLGTAYFQEDLEDADEVARLLDLAQIYQATITQRGWQFLIERMGLDRLLHLNRAGQWFDTDDDTLAAEQILHRARLAGFEPPQDCLSTACA
jgi:hypothetical protein